MKNKYVKRSKISEAKFRKILLRFSLDLEPKAIAILSGLNLNTIYKYLHLFRKRIAQVCEHESPFNGEIDLHEPDFGGQSIKGEIGQETEIKNPVFGILQRDDKVYTKIIPDRDKHMYQAVIQGKAKLESIIHSESWGGYDGLVDLCCKKYYQVQHGDDELAYNNNNINTMKSFYHFVKKRLIKFHVISDAAFYLHIKECEFRFNYRNKDIYMMLLKMIRDDPLL
jgi:transposase